MSDPAVENVVAFTGGGQRNAGSMFIALKPLAERPSAEAIIARLRVKLAKEPGATLVLNPVQDIRIGGRQSDATYQFTLQGDDLNELRTWTPALEAALRQVPEVLDVNSDQQVKGLQTTLTVDRETAARLGITPRMIDSALNLAFGQSVVSTIYSALEPVPRRDGAGAAVLAEPRGAQEHLRHLASQGPGAALIVRHLRVHQHCARGQSPGAVRRHHAVVQPAGERLPVRQREGNPGHHGAHRRADFDARLLPGHGPRLPEVAGEPAVADPRRARHRSTSCWGCSTRATCTRSPFSPPCPRPASGRCSRCCCSIPSSASSRSSA